MAGDLGNNGRQNGSCGNGNGNGGGKGNGNGNANGNGNRNANGNGEPRRWQLRRDEDGLGPVPWLERFFAWVDRVHVVVNWTDSSANGGVNGVIVAGYTGHGTTIQGARINLVRQLEEAIDAVFSQFFQGFKKPLEYLARRSAAC
ncbi:hypothetical protein RhiJN_17863 [Ceratobasidium sp. AG-Ba]|nr:hypothetical protein RhiJN_17863 [Ceratobasidium sp. AG-Ba]